METVPVRELQQHASAVLRRVKDGEIVGVTERGTLVAVVAPPDSVGGAAALIAAGRVRMATRPVRDIPVGPPSRLTVAEVLEDLDADRV